MSELLYHEEEIARYAERGKVAFDALDHDNNDRVTQTYDLIADLLHFADTIDGGSTLDVALAGGETLGESVAEKALWHYREALADLRAEAQQAARENDQLGTWL